MHWLGVAGSVWEQGRALLFRCTRREQGQPEGDTVEGLLAEDEEDYGQEAGAEDHAGNGGEAEEAAGSQGKQQPQKLGLQVCVANTLAAALQWVACTSTS